MSSVRAQLARGLGPFAEQLKLVAQEQASSARRDVKHTAPHARCAVRESDWWDCLLHACGLNATTAP